MKKYQYQMIIAIVLALFLVGCATQEFRVIDPTGRPLPNPHYVLRGVGDNMLSVMFYYSELISMEDVDGTRSSSPFYLELHEDHILSFKDGRGVLLTVAVQNPLLDRYSVYEEFELTTWKGEKINARRKIGTSEFGYRLFQISLPYWEGIKDVTHHLEIKKKGDELPSFMIGEFHYRVEKPDDRNPDEGR